MRKFIFVLGGIKSGKSKFAVSLAKKLREKTVFVATAKAVDKEMEMKIKKHKSLRPRDWGLIEESADLAGLIPEAGKKYDVVLIDCVGFWIANLLENGFKDAKIIRQVREAVKRAKNLNSVFILVSNDVGSSLVSDNQIGRRFQNLLGIANQIIAKAADEVFYMQAGIALKIKGEYEELLIRGKNGKVK